MYHIWRLLSIKLLLIIINLEDVLCSIDGTFVPRRPNATKFSGEDPCNPLYWYPRSVPEYCYSMKDMTTKPLMSNDAQPISMPIPVPMPPIPMPLPIPVPMPPPMIPPMMPPPIIPLPYPLPFGIPLAPSNPMLPVAYPPHPPPHAPGYPSGYPPHPPQPHVVSPFANYLPPPGIQRRPPMSMLPGLPGLVSPDGGINVLPFSDVYADVLEKHKQRMIRKRLQKLLDEYDGWPSRNSEEDVKRYSNDINNDENNHF